LGTAVYSPFQLSSSKPIINRAQTT
jgi:hypothetical protein